MVTQPTKALEMLKYQTLISAAFTQYLAEACLDYDRCFRQQAAKNRHLKWGKYKEDIFIWCFSPKPASVGLGNHANTWETRSFRPRPTINARLGPPSETVSHTAAGSEICIRFNMLRGCTKGDACKFKHVCNKRDCQGEHSATRCPKPKPT